MTDPFWGLLKKSGIDIELIEEAIERIFNTHNFNTNTTIWGMLPKALDDDQTINEAINEAIADHENDPDAHTNAGESLDTHKSQDIVDHPAGSILADKLSHTELVVEGNFESLDNWPTKVNVSLENWPGIRITYIGAVAGSLSSEPTAPVDMFPKTKNLLFQTTLWFQSATDVEAYWGIFTYISGSNLDGFGFRLKDEVVQGFCSDGTSQIFTSNLLIGNGNIHIYRADYNYDDDTVKFYIDGVLGATITSARSKFNQSSYIWFRYTDDGEESNFMHIYNALIGREI